MTALRAEGLEVRHSTRLNESVELDLLLRSGNHVAVAEATVSKKERKQKIDQLVSATQREHLGTYTARILIVTSSLDHANTALAAACRIQVISLTNSSEQGLDDADRCLLAAEVRKALGA